MLSKKGPFKARTERGDFSLVFPALSDRTLTDKVYHQLGQLFSTIFLKKMPPALESGIGLAFGSGNFLGKGMSLPLVMRMLALKAVRKGRSNFCSTSQTLRLAGAAGSSGEVGTINGKLRAPAL